MGFYRIGIEQGEGVRTVVKIRIPHVDGSAEPSICLGQRVQQRRLPNPLPADRDDQDRLAGRNFSDICCFWCRLC